MVTIKDVAKVAGVSTATVSRVVHNGGHVGDACRSRVKKVIEELGYRPNMNAQALVKRSTNTLGVVTPKLSMSFFGTLACGVEKAAKDQSYKLIMSNSLYETQSELDAINSLRDHHCDAIILHSEYSDEKTLIDLAEKIPGLVLINRYIPKIANRCVWLDNESAAKQATQYLVDKGHKDFAVVTSIYQNNDPEIRLRGIQDTLAANELQLHKNAVREATANLEGGEQAAKELLATGVKFTALIAYNDLMAIGAIHTLFDAGIRVPEDVSVIGFDNLSIAKACRPKLTTMHYPIEEMAHYAAELAIKLSDTSKAVSNRTHLFLSDIVERDSVSIIQ
ncbi:LacI family DNA-binding transcriptional regulator [Catenovulum adriaticum]|uniref:LacI family DNA-binding transcriptional regulator n=1 Tax=Catenovulum adriaticum TaxID=2984846 RepID=A0ABY7ASD9_9ALTE|nr:LacI family DNA-binding transcriptional regulator [Catenovulum sp. TS8]WAJ71682.1 LacI family DNA-binding transcriptional regulator [Catenovulum sp. TS8]